MGARSKARRRALDILFEADLRGRPVADVLTDMTERRRGEGTVLNPYIADLVTGVSEHADEIDRIISTYAIGWTIERMPAVDRNTLRMATYEIRFRDDVPNVVAISEAVALVTELSTDESPAFVNGVLARIAEMAPVDAADDLQIDPAAIDALLDHES